MDDDEYESDKEQIEEVNEVPFNIADYFDKLERKIDSLQNVIAEQIKEGVKTEFARAAALLTGLQKTGTPPCSLPLPPPSDASDDLELISTAANVRKFDADLAERAIELKYVCP